MWVRKKSRVKEKRRFVLKRRWEGGQRLGTKSVKRKSWSFFGTFTFTEIPELILGVENLVIV